MLWTGMSLNMLWTGMSLNMLWTGMSLNMLWTGMSLNMLWTGMSLNMLWTGMSLNMLWTDMSLNMLWTGMSLNMQWTGMSLNMQGVACPKMCQEPRVLKHAPVVSPRNEPGCESTSLPETHAPDRDDYRDCNGPDTVISLTFALSQAQSNWGLCRRAENGINSSSLTLTHLTSHTESFVNELLDLSVRRTISEIKDIQEEGGFVTIATIKGFDTEFRWFTELCKICRAKAEIDDTGKWVCTGRCQGYTKFVVLRYKIRVVVADHTGTATFIIFDSQATDLLQQSAKDVRENQIKHGDPIVYPPELNVLLDRKFIFKVKVDEKYNLTLGWESYGVNKLSEDPDLIERYLHSNQLLLRSTPATESDAKFNKEKEYSKSTCDNEMVTTSTEITPSKRCHDPSEDDGQFSTTKKQFSKKVECDQT
ncbi:hypothetical protein RND81_13G095700 [Saponaria officinalis]|uniref:Replication factor A C-terminal domain-containing protein n=1 Tax=Saponaria officinalis TaxID=3572 RepID=A0AAW1GYL4_SAPOF